NSVQEILPTLRMIHRNIELEARLIDDLLDLARVSRGQIRLDLEVIDVHEAILRSIEICRDVTLVAGLGVVTELAASRHHVTADFARVMQIAWNLIRNAAKFTKPNGRMVIRTANRRVPGDGFGADLELIVVDFEDSGRGIDPARLPRIFDSFQQCQSES